MVATLTRIVLGPSGSIWMIVIPDDDSQLSDPAFNPPGLTPVDVPNAAYQATKSNRDVFVLVQPVVAQKNANIGIQVSAKIQAIDDAVAAQEAPTPDDPTADALTLSLRLQYLAAIKITPDLTYQDWLATQPANGAAVISP